MLGMEGLQVDSDGRRLLRAVLGSLALIGEGLGEFGARHNFTRVGRVCVRPD